MFEVGFNIGEKLRRIFFFNVDTVSQYTNTPENFRESPKLRYRKIHTCIYVIIDTYIYHSNCVDIFNIEKNVHKYPTFSQLNKASIIIEFLHILYPFLFLILIHKILYHSIRCYQYRMPFRQFCYRSCSG